MYSDRKYKFSTYEMCLTKIYVLIPLQHRTHFNGQYFKSTVVNLLKPTGYVMHQQFNVQQLYVLLTL